MEITQNKEVRYDLQVQGLTGSILASAAFHFIKFLIDDNQNKQLEYGDKTPRTHLGMPGAPITNSKIAEWLGMSVDQVENVVEMLLLHKLLGKTFCHVPRAKCQFFYRGEDGLQYWDLPTQETRSYNVEVARLVHSRTQEECGKVNPKAWGVCINAGAIYSFVEYWHSKGKKIVNFTCNQIATQLGLSSQQIERATKALVKYGLISKTGLGLITLLKKTTQETEFLVERVQNDAQLPVERCPTTGRTTPLHNSNNFNNPERVLNTKSKDAHRVLQIIGLGEEAESLIVPLFILKGKEYRLTHREEVELRLIAKSDYMFECAKTRVASLISEGKLPSATYPDLYSAFVKVMSYVLQDVCVKEATKDQALNKAQGVPVAPKDHSGMPFHVVVGELVGKYEMSKKRMLELHPDKRMDIFSKMKRLEKNKLSKEEVIKQMIAEGFSNELFIKDSDRTHLRVLG